jgi:hypothetical protein
MPTPTLGVEELPAPQARFDDGLDAPVLLPKAEDILGGGPFESGEESRYDAGFEPAI